MDPFSAQVVYGAGPIRGQGPNGGPALRIQGGGGSVQLPTVELTPTAGNIVSGFADDPTFWLVFMFGTAAALIIWST